MANTVNIGISDLNVVKSPDVLATYALGSCVGICLLDKLAGIGGMAHIMLPSSKESKNASDNFRRYADTGIDELISMMTRRGARVSNMTAKIAGGAQMFQTQMKSFNIGERNVEAVKSVLKKYGIKIIAEDTGSNYGRTVFFNVQSGIMQVKSVTRGTVEL